MENSSKNQIKIAVQNVSSTSAFSLGVLPIIPLSPVHSKQVQSFSEKKEGSIQTGVSLGSSMMHDSTVFFLSIRSA